MHLNNNNEYLIHIGMRISDGPKTVIGRQCMLDMTPDDAEKLVVRLAEYIKKARDNL